MAILPGVVASLGGVDDKGKRCVAVRAVKRVVNQSIILHAGFPLANTLW